MSTAASTQWQYFTGVSDPALVAPESYTLDQFFLDREGNVELQLDLFKDYASNVALYSTFHEYFRKNQPALLAVWGDKDPFFLPPGAEAFKHDLPNAIVKFFDTGHFALETHVNEIGEEIIKFLATLPQ
jgi:pimeloyl-ACP methyl ester carboxylesterase